MTELNEVLKSLIDLTSDELRQVRLECTDRIEKNAKRGLEIGDTVQVTNENAPTLYKITKKNRVKWVIKKLERPFTSYNCPPGLLRKSNQN